MYFPLIALESPTLAEYSDSLFISKDTHVDPEKFESMLASFDSLEFNIINEFSKYLCMIDECFETGL